MMLQSLALLLERVPNERYKLVFAVALTSLLYIATIVLDKVSSRLQQYTWKAPPPLFTYQLVGQVMLATCVLLSALSLPRRPVHSNRPLPVDGQYNASIWSRYTFQWGYDVLRRARSKGSLDLLDLPVLPSGMSSARLHNRFQAAMKSDNLTLWKVIFLVHWRTFLQQYALSMLQSAAQTAPQLAMYSLLQGFELRGSAQTEDATSWWWVIALGTSMMVAAWIETQSLWIMWSQLVICIRSELIALVFATAMQKKDVKTTRKQKVESLSTPQTDSERTMFTGKRDEHEDGSTRLYGTQMSTVNLVGVDAKRVVDFIGASHLLPSSLCKLVISIAFLCNLIGWQSILAGLAVLVALTPFNLYLSMLMSKAQGQIMQARDEKMSVINEALQGIRQIKISASEQQWLAEIRWKRNRELEKQLYCFILRTALVGIWALGPVAISAVALTVHTLLHGYLSPSVAFTSIAVLAQIEGSLAIIPKLVMQMLEADVSAARIDQYLQGTRLMTYMEHGAAVSLREASISWPTAEPMDRSGGMFLHGINVTFPPGNLSIISGKTGSGKSLLLAAIVGEGERLSGAITAPGCASTAIDSSITPAGWIIPEATAFVAQVPWIENASIRDNILFGLCFEVTRYKKVLAACALTKDLGE